MTTTDYDEPQPCCGGNTSVTESVNPVAQLSRTYERLGLAPGDAWDAAVADYRAFRERLAPGPA